MQRYDGTNPETESVAIVDVDFRHYYPSSDDSDPRQFDTDIVRARRSSESFTVHASALTRFIVSGDSLAELPHGSTVAPNQQPDWYAEHGTLLVFDTETIHVGDILSQEDIEAYEPYKVLFEEPPHNLLAYKVSQVLDSAEQANASMDLQMNVLRFCGHNRWGQQIILIRSVSVGVLHGRNGQLHCAKYTLHWKEGKIHGKAEKEPADKSLRLPAVVGEIQPVRITSPSSSVVSQRLRGVTVVDTLTRPQHGSRQRSRRFGSIALRPTFSS